MITLIEIFIGFFVGYIMGLWAGFYTEKEVKKRARN
jgi:ABC-type dipeptide/oligopeptide/nickel transport system permease subunit